MSNYLAFRKIEEIEKAHNKFKQTAISKGVDESVFKEVDDKIAEIKAILYKNIQGGMIQESTEGEFIFPSPKTNNQ